jgi:hypothetical protein
MAINIQPNKIDYCLSGKLQLEVRDECHTLQGLNLIAFQHINAKDHWDE